MSTPTIHIRVPADTFERLQARSAAEMRPVTQMALVILTRALEDPAEQEVDASVGW